MSKRTFSIILPALFIITMLQVSCKACKSGESSRPLAGEDDEKKPPADDDGDEGKKAPCFRKTWGPMLLSSDKLNVVGLSAATGVGQVGVLWIEVGQGKSEVFFTRIAGSEKTDTLQVTGGASGFPPTAMAWTGKDFYLTWGDDTFRRIELFVARIAPNGAMELAPKQFTRTKSPKDADVYSSDSSQEPAMTYYEGNLLMVWGGPGDYARQHIYHTTISKSGKPIYQPDRITSGPYDHTGFNLVPSDNGANLYYCVNTSTGNEVYRTRLSGTPPRAEQEPSSVLSTIYSPCRAEEFMIGDRGLILWPEKTEKRGIITCTLKFLGVMPDGSFRSSVTLKGTELVMFPGKMRRAFDGIKVDDQVAVAWVDVPPAGGQTIKTAIFQESGNPVCEPVEMESNMIPTDSRILYAGHGRQYVVLWVDRRIDKPFYSLYGAGLEIP
ncbi:MAG: hypothetical protein ABIJ56_10030 [Pseudomonadota bacterium]